MKCKYCGIAYDSSKFDPYHNEGCSVQGAIKIKNAEKKKPVPREVVKPVTQVIEPDRKSESLTQAKEKRRPGRPRKEKKADDENV